MSVTHSGIAALIYAWASRLRYPQLMALVTGLLVLDVLVPDVVPFVDEILLALLTLLVGSRKKKTPPQPQGRTIDGEVTDRAGPRE